MQFYREFWRYSHFFTICVFVLVMVFLSRSKIFAFSFDCHVHTPNSEEFLNKDFEQELLETIIEKNKNDRKYEKEKDGREADYQRENSDYYRADRDMSDYR